MDSCNLFIEVNVRRELVEGIGLGSSMTIPDDLLPLPSPDSLLFLFPLTFLFIFLGTENIYTSTSKILE